MRLALATCIALAGFPAGAQEIELLIPGVNDRPAPPTAAVATNPLAACLANPTARACAAINNRAAGDETTLETFVPDVQFEVLSFDPTAGTVKVVKEEDHPPVTNYVQPVPTDKPTALPSVAITIEFDFDSDQIRADQFGKVASLAAALQDPALAGTKYAVIGHTDAKGSDFYNCDLSKRRARTVAGVLAANLVSVPLIPVGFGETALKNVFNPAASENRRVTFLRLPDDPTPILSTAGAICGV